MRKTSGTKPFYPIQFSQENLDFKFHLSDAILQAKVEEVLRPFILNSDTIERIRNIFKTEMDLGLASKPERQSSLLMENTFVPELPDGTEEGEYIALDLGGTNFRVIWLHMENGRISKSVGKDFTVPLSAQQGDGSELFEFLADCTHTSLEQFGLLNRPLPLGFTFSFPMIQTALDVGILARWTKSYTCTGGIGKDAVKLLNDALHRKGDVQMDVIAILNDTTGVLVNGAYLDHKTAVGVGLGTGFNACYLEKVEKVEKWEEHPGVTEVAIDTECGGFGDNGVVDFLKTDVDNEVDESSPLVKSYTFEKYISGKYLGEVVRCVCLKLVRKNLLFSGKNINVFDRYESFSTKHISMVESDKNCTDSTKLVLEELGLLEDAIEDDIAILRYVCSIVSNRAAQLVAACLSCLLERVDRDDVTIAVDGSLYKLHPKFHSLITMYLAELVPTMKFRIMLAEDGSGVGAGLTAAVAERLRSRKN